MAIWYKDLPDGKKKYPQIMSHSVYHFTCLFRKGINNLPRDNYKINLKPQTGGQYYINNHIFCSKYVMQVVFIIIIISSYCGRLKLSLVKTIKRMKKR
jgi:hypothetical protein